MLIRISGRDRQQQRTGNKEECLLNRDQRRPPPEDTQASPDAATEQPRYPTPAVHPLSNPRNDRPKKNVRRFILPAAVLAVGIIAVLLICTHGPGSIPATPEPAPLVIGGGEPIPGDQGKQKDIGSSHLPAYDQLSFTAGEKEQNLVLQNPGENSCLIRFSLILEDGTVVYQSELVEPGYYTRPITLLKPLKQGVYEHVTLKYECFTVDSEHTALNSATSKLTVIVE